MTSESTFKAAHAILLLLLTTHLHGQEIISAKKLSDSSATLDFDKETTLLIKFASKQQVTHVSYIELQGKESFFETVSAGLARDAKLEKKYPFYCTNCADPITGKIDKSKYNHLKQHNTIPRFKFLQIPPANFSSHGDSLIVKFTVDKTYVYNPQDKLNHTYFSDKTKGNGQIKIKEKVKYGDLQRQYFYLKPNSRYALLIFLPNPANVSLIFDQLDQFFHYLPLDPLVALLALLQAQHTYLLIQQKQMKIPYPGPYSFFPEFSDCLQTYNGLLAGHYKMIRLSDTKLQTISLSIQDPVRYMYQNDLITSVLAFERARQNAKPPVTGSPDSLTVFETIASNLFNGDATYFQKITSGALTLRQPVDSKYNERPDSAAKNIVSSLDDLNEFRSILNYYYSVEHHAVDETAFAAFAKALDQWIALLSQSLDLNKKVGDQRLEIKKSIDNVFSAPLLLDESTVINNFQTRGQLTLIPDFGLIYYGFAPFNANSQFMSVSPYLGVEVNWRPLDKNVYFRNIPYKTWYSLHHWSTTVGITLISMAYPGKRTDLFSKTSLMLGMGYRLGSAIRITGGALFFNKYDSYFSLNKSLAVTPYVGLSIDLDFKKIFGSIVDAFTTK